MDSAPVILMMLRFFFGLGLLGLLTSTVYTGMVITAAILYLRSRRQVQSSGYTPAVSMLKPLHGAEPGLEAHIESFFQQNYPEFEILFCARTQADAGLQIARRVAARYPSVPVRFLATGEEVAINAKVSSLVLMEQFAAHSILVVSDSDVSVGPDYLRQTVQPFADKAVGLTTCLYRGCAQGEGLWANLEAAGMSVEMTSGVLVARMIEGMHFALGPTMVMRREAVHAMGGFAQLGSYCADDFLIGQLISAKGYKVLLSNYVINHHVLNAGLVPSLQHQVRWMKSTRFSRPKGHFGTSLTFAVPFGILTAVFGIALGHTSFALAALGWTVVTRALTALFLGGGVLQEKRLLTLMLLYPLRDLMGFGFWAASYLSSTIFWRGVRYQLVPGGYMLALNANGTPVPESRPVSKEKSREPALT